MAIARTLFGGPVGAEMKWHSTINTCCIQLQLNSFMHLTCVSVSQCVSISHHVCCETANWNSNLRQCFEFPCMSWAKMLIPFFQSCFSAFVIYPNIWSRHSMWTVSALLTLIWRESTGDWQIPLTKGNTEIWCFLWVTWNIAQTGELSVISDAIPPMWRHHYDSDHTEYRPL